MNSDRMGQKILQSVSIVVERAIKTAGYDKTVQATIVSCADESIGKYRVRYQGGIWYAFSSSPDVSYRENDNVYVLVPNGDMDKQKTILGTTDQLGQNFVSIIQDRDNYNQIGDNLIQFKQGYNGSYGLISRKRIQDSQDSYSYQNSSIILYEYGSANNHIAQSPNRISNYLKNADNFLLSMDVQTDFSDSQIGVGNYGLKLELVFNDNETGNEIIREYILDTQDMVGDRYNYLMPTEQSAIFSFDKENFVRVNKISLFTEGFNSYSTEEDIFISNLQFIALQALTQEEKEGVNFKINFPKGFIFTSRPKADNTGEVIYTAEAHFRVQMREVDIKNQNLKFYWFRQNPRIQAQHKTYSSYAGPGWTCLNPRLEGNTKEKFSQLSPKNILEVSNGSVLGEECHFKCVAIYNGQVFSKEFIFKQTDSLYKISILSTNGFEFTNDIGSTKLTCNLNNPPSNIKYQWCKYNSQGKYQAIQNATGSNITVQIKDIVNFATYKCAVYDQNDNFLTAASVKLINKIGTEGTYSIILNNADAMYVYNENGVSPTNQSMEKPQQVSTLSLIVYNDKGEEIPKNVLTSSKTNLEWHIPKIDTLIKIDSNYENFKNKIEENDTEYVIKNVTEVPYTIEDRYDIRKNKNTINVKIVYAGRVLTAFTNFTFMKQGQPGTNGTDMQIRLVPHVPEGVSKAVFNRTYPMVQIGNGITKMNWTYSNTQDSRVTGSWFDVQMFLSGSQIFNDYRDNQDSSGNPIKVLWSMLRNTGFEWIHSDKVLISTIIGKLTTLINKTTTDDIHLSQDEIRYLNSLESKSQYVDLKNIHNDSNKGRASQDYINKLREINFPCFYIDDFQKNFRDKYSTYFNASNEKKNVNFPPVHVLKAEVTRAGKKYFAEMPLISMIYLTDDIKYKAQLKLDSGFRYVIYDADGTHPSYNNNDPFEINVTGVTSEKISYKYFISGNLTIQKNGISGNKIQLMPKSLYDGSVLNNALMVQIAIDNVPKLFLHIPIHFMLNQYGQAALNDWDGVSIKINDEEDSYILAPQIGAGEKGIDNSFTGIMMGKVYTSGSGSKIGLFGYSKGRESIFLNADDGSASFGLPAAGQIKIQPGEDTAYIQGGDYIENDNNGSGMKMNLSSGNDGPWIRFGSGNFSIDNKGYLTAKGGGSIANWDIHKDGYLSSKDNTVGMSSENARTGNIYITTLEDAKDDKGNPIKVRKTKTESKSIAFWAGKTDNKTNFLITHDGYLLIRQATIGTGNSTNRIYIAGPDDINQSAIFTGGHVNFNDTANGFYLGTDGLSLANTFSVDEAGYLKAKKGEIANWFIDKNCFYTEDSSYFEKATRKGMYFGKDGIGILDKFWVDISQKSAYFKGQIQTDSGKIGNWTIIENALYSIGNDKNRIKDRQKDLEGFEVSIEDILRDYYINNNGKLAIKEDFIKENQEKNIEPYKEPLRKLQLYLKAWKQLQEEYRIKNKQIVYSITKVKEKLKEQDKLTDDESRILNKIDNQKEEIRNKKDPSSSRVCEAYINALKKEILNRIKQNEKRFLGLYFGSKGLWLGNDFRVNANGGITATSGKIANWSFNNKYLGWIEESSISNDKFKELDTVGMQLTSSTYQDLIDHSIYFGEKGLRIGNKFQVDNKGNLEGTSVKLSGEIKASSGKIANYWDITENSISHDRETKGDKEKDLEKNVGNDTRFGLKDRLYFGRKGLSISDVFSVDADGKLTATSAEVKGKITADQGKIGKWSISNTSLTTRQGFKDNLTKGIVKKLEDYYLKALNNLQKTTEWKNAKTDEEKRTLWEDWQKNKMPEEQKLTGEESGFLDELDKNNKEYLRVFKNDITSRTCKEYINALKEVIDPIYYMKKDSTGATTYTVPSDDDIYLGENGIRVGSLFYVLPDLSQGTKGTVLGAAKIGPWIFTGKSIRTRVTGVSKEKIIDQDHVFVQKTLDNDGFITKVDDDTNNNYVLQQGCYFGQEGIRVGDNFYVDIESDESDNTLNKIKKYINLYDRLKKYIDTWNKNKTWTLKKLSVYIQKEDKDNYISGTEFTQIETEYSILKKYQNYQQGTGRVNKYYLNQIAKIIEDLENSKIMMSKLYLKGTIKTTNGQIGNWRIGSNHIGWIDNNPEINGKESLNFATETRYEALDRPIENQLDGSLRPEFIKNSIYFGKYGLRIGDYFYIKASKDIKEGKNDSLAYFAGKIQAETGKIANWDINQDSLIWLNDTQRQKALKNSEYKTQTPNKNFNNWNQCINFLDEKALTIPDFITNNDKTLEGVLFRNSIYFGNQGLRMGTTFSVNNRGQLIATSGSIGGWTITSEEISATGITLNKNGTITIKGESTLNIGGVTLKQSGGGASAGGGSGLTVSGGTFTGGSITGGTDLSTDTTVNNKILSAYIGDCIIDNLTVTEGLTVPNKATIKFGSQVDMLSGAWIKGSLKVGLAQDKTYPEGTGQSYTIYFGDEQGSAGKLEFINGILVSASKTVIK